MPCPSFSCCGWVLVGLPTEEFNHGVECFAASVRKVANRWQKRRLQKRKPPERKRLRDRHLKRRPRTRRRRRSRPLNHRLRRRPRQRRPWLQRNRVILLRRKLHRVRVLPQLRRLVRLSRNARVCGARQPPPGCGPESRFANWADLKFRLTHHWISSFRMISPQGKHLCFWGFTRFGSWNNSNRMNSCDD